MLRPRIIPCLLIHERGLVKTVRFTQPKYVGDPINVVKIFNEKLVDELIVLDIDATAKTHDPDLTTISQLAAESRMPICYGGGVKTADMARSIIGLGVEKVAVSSAAISHPELINEIARSLGSQSIVVVLDVKQRRDGEYGVWTHNGKQDSGRLLIDLAQEMERRGAGEIVVNSIDRDGMMGGYDVPMTRRLRAAVGVPISVIGGAGKISDIAELVEEFPTIGAAAGSLFVFKGPYKAVLVNYPTPSTREGLAAVATGAR